MVRTQVQVTEEQSRALKRLAAERGVSMAELIRDGVKHVLARAERERDWGRALEALGRHRGEGGPASEEHDRHLDDAYSA